MFTCKRLGWLLCLLIPITTHAQLDSIAKAKTAARRALNTTKLELQYETVQKTSYSSRGVPTTYNITYQLLSINDKKPVEIDRRGEILRRYYNRCWEARELLDQGSAYVRKGNKFKWGGLLAGSALAFSGVFANPKMSGGRLALGVGLGLGAMTTGGVLWFTNRNKGRDLIHKSVDVYNAKCYAFPMTDSAKKAKQSRPDSTAKNIDGKDAPLSEKKYVNNTVYYDLLRNDPANSDFSALAIHLASVEVSELSVNIKGGLGLLYSHNGKYSISADYRIAYLDNPKADRGSKSTPNVWNDVAGPVSFRNSTNLDITTAVAFRSWTVEKKYGLDIGRKKVGRTTADVVSSLKAEVQKALMFRLGYQRDSRLIKNNGSLDYATTTPPYIYHYDGKAYEVTPVLGSQSTIIRSDIVTAGISLSSFWDLKIRLRDSDYKGTREVKKQVDYYADLMYAPNIKFQDMLYWAALRPFSGESGHVPLRLDLNATPVSKAGGRIGLRMNGMGSRFGLRMGVEGGIRPGPKASADQRAYLNLNFGLLLGRTPKD